MLTVSLSAYGALIATTEDGREVELTQENAYRLLKQFLRPEPRKPYAEDPSYEAINTEHQIKHYDAKGRRADPGYLPNGLDIRHLIGA